MLYICYQTSDPLVITSIFRNACYPNHLQNSVMEIATETTRPAAVTTNVTNANENEEQPATGYMHGWALASLTLAFMSICLVLAIDNTILGSLFPQSGGRSIRPDCRTKQRRYHISPATSKALTISAGMGLPT